VDALPGGAPPSPESEENEVDDVQGARSTPVGSQVRRSLARQAPGVRAPGPSHPRPRNRRRHLRLQCRERGPAPPARLLEPGAYRDPLARSRKRSPVAPGAPSKGSVGLSRAERALRGVDPGYGKRAHSRRRGKSRARGRGRGRGELPLVFRSRAALRKELRSRGEHLRQARRAECRDPELPSLDPSLWIRSRDRGKNRASRGRRSRDRRRSSGVVPATPATGSLSPSGRRDLDAGSDRCRVAPSPELHRLHRIWPHAAGYPTRRSSAGDGGSRGPTEGYLSPGADRSNRSPTTKRRLGTGRASPPTSAS